MTPLEILRAAREKIADPKTWTTGAYARATDWTEVQPRSDKAERFCMLGALDAVAWLAAVDPALFAARKDAYGLLVEAVAWVGLNLGPAAIDRWNDAPGREHADVLAVYDRAIARAAAQGGSP